MIIKTIASDFTFTECPRWHNNKLWFSDFYTQAVYSIDADNQCRTELQLDDQPAGLGWRPNGDLCVVSQEARKLLGYNGKQTYEIADLSDFAPANCNDMIMLDDGSAYIGHFGFDFHAPDFTPKPASLIHVSATGHVSIAAENMFFPNGSVILPASENNQRPTLVVAESMGHCLTAFTITPTGELTDRRLWANLGRPASHTLANFQLDNLSPDAITPDGIAADKNGGIWVATLKNQLIRVIEGGDITDDIQMDQAVIACAVGDNHQLYVCTTAHLTPESCTQHRSARIECIHLGK